MSTVVTVVVLNIHHRGVFGDRIPIWLRVLVLDWLATLTFMKKMVDRNVDRSDADTTKVLSRIFAELIVL